ncbi:TonB-dependent receptor domain-containing protein [Sphingomonas sp. URHD0057]|uniref:TonB-dependent receptor domain-containing protein n=1 Tax=Sphingomonas sp. URHD0057 TaxID=1380389 RepID=UPI0018CC1D48|nr:TonB-dependent receptor [Sphingomonas sp. URHD0057]
MGGKSQWRAAGLCAIAFALQAQAPPKQQQPTDVDQATAQPIVITGSRIPRRNLTAVSPVTVVQQEEAKLEGVILTEELLNQLPMVSPSQGAFTSAGATGTSTVDLRGLGAARTLVLLNGRRLIPGDPGEIAPDINAVPSALIERVEVLTGGASSVYGSDAVAGVVNFILDTRLEGLRVDGQASFFQHDNRIGPPIRDVLVEEGLKFPRGSVVDGGRWDVNAAYGTAFLDGRGHAIVYAGYRKLQSLTEDRRDYSACTIGTQEFDPNALECGGLQVSFPGTFETLSGTYQIGPDRTFEPGFVPFSFAPWNFYQRPDRRYTAGAFADFEFNDAVKPFVEVMYMDDRSTVQVAPSGNFFGTTNINCDSPLLSEQQRSLVCSAGNFIGEESGGSRAAFTDPVTGKTYYRGWLFIGRRNVEGGPRRDDLRHENLRVVGGIKGDLRPGLAYDASYIYSRVKFSAAFTNELSATRIGRSLDVISDPSTGRPVCRSVLTGEDPACVPWDIFAFGAVTPEATKYLAQAAQRAGLVREQIASGNLTAEFEQWGVRSPWAEDGPAINFGAEYRKDFIDFRPDQFYQSGDLAGSEPMSPYSGSIEVKELFGEARIPLIQHRLIERLALEGGYRQSWYSNPENRFSTNSYKLALDFVPVRGIRFRASHQRAVRAPNIVELFAPTVFYTINKDPCAGVSPEATLEQCQRTGVTAAQYGHVLAIPSDSFGYQALAGGNARLEPETATTRTLGVVLEPRFVPGFNATIDWFDIRVKGAVAEIGARPIIENCLASGDPLFCGRIHRDLSGSLWLTPEGFIDDRNANVASFDVRGIDIGVNYSRKLGRFGSANLEFLGSRLQRNVIDNGGLSTPRNCAGYYGFPCGIPLPRWRHTARLTWRRGGVSLSAYWRHIGGTRLASIKYRPDIPFTDRDAKLPDYDYFDLGGLFNVGSNYGLRLGVNNIFDKPPPIVTATLAGCAAGCNGNTFPQLYDPLGFFFAGATLDFK